MRRTLTVLSSVHQKAVGSAGAAVQQAGHARRRADWTLLCRSGRHHRRRRGRRRHGAQLTRSFLVRDLSWTILPVSHDKIVIEHDT
jgi:hypothetical protein